MKIEAETLCQDCCTTEGILTPNSRSLSFRVFIILIIILIKWPLHNNETVITTKPIYFPGKFSFFEEICYVSSLSRRAVTTLWTQNRRISITWIMPNVFFISLESTVSSPSSDILSSCLEVIWDPLHFSLIMTPRVTSRWLWAPGSVDLVGGMSIEIHDNPSYTRYRIWLLWKLYWKRNHKIIW